MSILNNVLFIDIETAPQMQFLPLEGKLVDIFKKKHQTQWNTQNEQWENIYQNQAGLAAEFGKIVCVSIGQMKGDKFYVKSFCSRFEKTILEQLALVFDKDKESPRPMILRLSGHNIKEFDGPYLMRRYFINDLPVPRLINMIGVKTWDIPYDDTMEMWSGSQWKYKCSLDLLAICLNIPSPKQEMSGSDVATIFYSMFDDVQKDDLPFEKEKEVLEKIGNYCAGDVITTAQVFCKLKGLPALRNDQIYII
jgi:hypothetical protein